MLDELILFSRRFNILVMSRDFIFIKLILPLRNSLPIYIWTRRTAAVTTFSEGQIVLGAVSRVQSVCYEMPAGSPLWMVLECDQTCGPSFSACLNNTCCPAWFSSHPDIPWAVLYIAFSLLPFPSLSKQSWVWMVYYFLWLPQYTVTHWVA